MATASKIRACEKSPTKALKPTSSITSACTLDRCATLQLPVMGYGIRYEYGMFRQPIIENGYQIEEPDHWLMHGSPWEMIRPEYAAARAL